MRPLASLPAGEVPKVDLPAEDTEVVIIRPAAALLTPEIWNCFCTRPEQTTRKRIDPAGEGLLAG